MVLRLPIPPRQRPSKLPEILSHQELERLFAAAHLPQTPRPADDHLCRRIAPERGHCPEADRSRSQRQMIRVEQGKGRKDRYTILSPKLLEELRLYWKMFRPISLSIFR